MDNPYVGTEWEQSWQEGHDAGVSQPDAIVDHPDALEPNQATAYDEGVLAGQNEANQGSAPIQINPVQEPEQPGFPTKLAATAAFSVVELVESAGSGWLFTAVHILIDISIPEGDPTVDLSDPGILSNALTSARQRMRADDLYMAFCQNSSHSAVGDQVTSAGYWHSTVFTDYWSAYPIATDHLSSEPDSLGQVGIVHVTSASDGVEWIELA